MIDQEDPELWVRDYAKYAEEMSRKAEFAQEAFAEIEGQASNEYVSLKVNSGGVLTDLTFTSRVRSISPDELAQQVLDAFAVAVTSANSQTQGYLRDITGDTEMADYARDVVSDDLRARAARIEEEKQR